MELNLTGGQFQKVSPAAGQDLHNKLPETADAHDSLHVFGYADGSR